MDKKKVEELIEQIQKYCDQAYSPNWQPKSFKEFVKLGNICREAIKELSKSDWVSVEDELPPCEEEVLVRDINARGGWSKPWICYRSKNESYRHITDKHKFVTTRLGEITHWRPIEKLEE